MGDARKNEYRRKKERKQTRRGMGGGQGPRLHEQDLGKENRKQRNKTDDP